MTRVVALVVTHNSMRWIDETLASITAQDRMPDSIVVVDDASTDGTREWVRELLGERVTIVPSTAASEDRTTRIAHNFRQGVQACEPGDIVVLGDHDDIWHTDRVSHQASLLEELPDVAMVASDGRLVDEAGNPQGGTLRTTFPVRAGFNELSEAERMSVVLRRSGATGGASAVRRTAFADVYIPDGWLHDRWWSLVAAAREQLLLDDALVIDYRVSAGQEVGLDTGLQEHAKLARLIAGASGVRTSMSKMDDIRQRLVPFATEATKPELTGTRLLRNLM